MADIRILSDGSHICFDMGDDILGPFLGGGGHICFDMGDDILGLFLDNSGHICGMI
jgi:hypothetical protein